LADISKLKLPGSETIYDLKDQGARDLIAALPKALVFKGTLGTGGTISALPEASADTVGHVYKVITEGTYAGKAAKVGDLFIGANTGIAASPVYAWELVPSGDEPSGTVTNVATGDGLTGGPITTSGTISLDTSYTATTDHAGLAPALPGLEADKKYLAGDGSWKKIDSIPVISLAVGTITTGNTSTTVNYSGTVVNAYMVDANNKMVMTDITIGPAAVTFTLAAAATEPFTCRVLASNISVSIVNEEEF